MLQERHAKTQAETRSGLPSQPLFRWITARRRTRISVACSTSKNLCLAGRQPVKSLPTVFRCAPRSFRLLCLFNYRAFSDAKPTQSAL